MEEIQRQPHLHAFRFDPIIENREQVGHSLARAIGRDREPEAFMRLGLLPRLLDKILCVSRISILIVRLANSLPLAASACKAPAKFSVHAVSSGPGRGQFCRSVHPNNWNGHCFHPIPHTLLLPLSGRSMFFPGRVGQVP